MTRPAKPQANDQAQDQAVDLKLDEEDRWERMFEHETDGAKFTEAWRCSRIICASFSRRMR